MIIESMAPVCATRAKRKHVHHFYCVILCVWTRWRVGCSEDSCRATHGVWGFEATACGPLSLWQSGPANRNVGHGYGRTRDREEAKVLCRRAETRKRRRHRQPAALETCSTHVRMIHGKSPRPGLPRICPSGSTLPPEGAHTGTIEHKMSAVLRSAVHVKPQAS